MMDYIMHRGSEREFGGTVPQLLSNGTLSRSVDSESGEWAAQLSKLDLSLSENQDTATPKALAVCHDPLL